MSEVARAELLAFLRAHRYAVEASRAVAGVQAAVIGIAVLDNFDIVFDTLTATRKAQNFLRDPAGALVVGGLSEGEARTVQIEGVVDQPAGAELVRLQQRYFEVFPDGRDRLAWPGLIHLRLRPHWMRYSDFRQDPPLIVELTARDLVAEPPVTP